MSKPGAVCLHPHGPLHLLRVYGKKGPESHVGILRLQVLMFGEENIRDHEITFHPLYIALT